MEFSSPVKLPDGRYYVKLNSVVQLVEKNVKLGEIQDDMVLTLKNTAQIRDYDQKLVDAAVQNSQTWFQREIVPEVISGYYQSALEDSVLQLVPHTTPKGKIAVALFSDDKKKVDSIVPGTECTALLQLDGLWFLKKSFGPVWKLLQVKVKKPVPEVQCLLDDDEDEE